MSDKQPNALGVLARISGKFRSGNDILVESARISRDEWENVLLLCDEMGKALETVAQSHAWHIFGECRSFGDHVRLLEPNEADELAKSVIAKWKESK